jgi:hypothetical protein
MGAPRGFLFPPMLFPRDALASRPQVCFLMEKKKVEGQDNFPSCPGGENQGKIQGKCSSE